MTYDLRREPWLPFRRRSGRTVWGAPSLLTDDLAGDPIVALAAPRPDLDGALHEFLIGLLTVGLRPPDEDAWRRWRDVPPTPAELAEHLAALPNAFALDGDGARAFQDRSTDDLADCEPGPVEQLLIDAPGDQGIRFNKDLFVKRGRCPALSRPAAAMALVAMQTYAPAGGSGHRTSMRGGGPLTTLVEPRVDEAGTARADERPLWQLLWANVETLAQLEVRAPQGDATLPAPDDRSDAAMRCWARVFPWLAPTRTSDKGGSATTPVDAHPLQAYFGLPRRIRLVFDEAPATCALTGLADAHPVVGFRMRNYGVQYQAWRHPLSPHYRSKEGEWLPLHGQPGGIGWRDWLGLALRQPDDASREPAAVVAHYVARRAGRRGFGVARLRVFGYDMDNMKARGWTESALPVVAAADAGQARLLADTAARLAAGTGLAASALLGAVERALFHRPEDAPGDLGAVRTALWDAMQDAYYAALAEAATLAPETDATTAALDALCERFRSALVGHASVLFDARCDAVGLAPATMRRHVAARFDLVMTLRGHSKLGQKLLGPDGFRLAPPAPASKSRATKTAAPSGKAPAARTRPSTPTPDAP